MARRDGFDQTTEKRLDHLEKMVFSLLNAEETLQELRDKLFHAENLNDTTYKMYQNANEKLSRADRNKEKIYLIADTFSKDLEKELNKI